MRSALFLAVFAVVAGRGGCDPAYDPCDGMVCGEACTACAPGDADCAETAVLKTCDARGRCVAEPVECSGMGECLGQPCGAPCNLTPPCAGEVCPMMAMLGACDGRGACADPALLTCEPPPWDPCADKACGEPCSPCPPEETCPTFAATACDPFGRCATAGTFTCEPPPPPPDPCLGKRCGEDCTIDPPCAPLCMMPSMLGKCDPFGLCQPVGEVRCEPPPPPPDPCLGKGCGAPCGTCDATAGMMCPAVMMYCDAAGACGFAFPVCRG